VNCVWRASACEYMCDLFVSECRVCVCVCACMGMWGIECPLVWLFVCLFVPLVILFVCVCLLVG